MDADVVTFYANDRSNGKLVTLTAPTPEPRTGCYAAFILYHPDGKPYISSVTSSADPVPDRR